MSSYTCQRCYKDFKIKSTYLRHLQRKTPCKELSKDIKEIVNVVDEIKPSYTYSKLSYELTKKINTIEKKNNGIFFTPPTTVYKTIEYLKPYMSSIKDVLEPSCGSCEFILQLHSLYPDLFITGVENNTIIYENIKHLQNEKITLHNEDFITFDNPKKYDLIFGNPPYFVMKKKDVDSSYYTYFDGRPNIFILFIIKSISYLNPNGIISFILPKSFLNCLYYTKTRTHIFENFKIIVLEECKDSYIETAQETILFIIQSTNNDFKYKDEVRKINSAYSIMNEYSVFGIPSHIQKINELYKDSTTLQKLGFNVNVGNIVWNQHKSILTDDISKTLLIYSSDIKNNTLSIQSYSNKEKKNYINKKGITGPLLIINRGYGVGNYSFEYCLINLEKEYLIENHLICIRYTQKITSSKLIKLYEKIIKSLQDKRTTEFVKLYFGNNAINTSEISEILPIYL